MSLIVDGIEEAVSELFAGLGLIYQKMEKERAKNETCLRLNKINKRRKLHDRPSQRPNHFVPKKVGFRKLPSQHLDTVTYNFNLIRA